LGSIIPLNLTQLITGGDQALNPGLLQRPLLYSEWKGIDGIKTSDPFALDPALGATTPLPQLVSVDGLRLSAPEKTGTVPVARVIPEIINRESPPQSVTDPPRRLADKIPALRADRRNPRSFHTPLNWSAVRSRHVGSKSDEKETNRPDILSFIKWKGITGKRHERNEERKSAQRFFQPNTSQLPSLLLSVSVLGAPGVSASSVLNTRTSENTYLGSERTKHLQPETVPKT
jgi:hypothetical protein